MVRFTTCLSITLVCWLQSFSCYLLRSTWYYLTQFKILPPDVIWTPETLTLGQVLLAVLGSIYLLMLVPMIVQRCCFKPKPNNANANANAHPDYTTEEKAHTHLKKVLRACSLSLSHVFLLSVCLAMTLSQDTPLSMVLLGFALSLTIIHWSLAFYSDWSPDTWWTLAMQDLCVDIPLLLLLSTLVVLLLPMTTVAWPEMIYVGVNLWPVTVWTVTLAWCGGFLPATPQPKIHEEEEDSTSHPEDEQLKRERKSIIQRHLKFKRWVVYPLTLVALVVVQREEEVLKDPLAPPVTPAEPSPNLFTSMDQCAQEIKRLDKPKRADFTRRLTQHRSCISGAVNVFLSEAMYNLVRFFDTLSTDLDELDDLVALVDQVVAFLVDVPPRDHAFICQQMHRHIQPCLVQVATSVQEWILEQQEQSDARMGYCAQMLGNVQRETGESVPALISQLSNLLTNVQCSTRESWLEDQGDPDQDNDVPCSYVWIQSLLSTIVNEGKGIAAMSLDEIGGQLKKMTEIPSGEACEAYTGQLYRNTRDQRTFLNLDRALDSCVRPLDSSIQYIRRMPWVVHDAFDYGRLFQLEQCLGITAIEEEYDVELPREVFPAEMCLHVPNSFSDDCVLFLYEWAPVTENTYSSITNRTILDETFCWIMAVWILILFVLWGIAILIDGAQKLTLPKLW